MNCKQHNNWYCKDCPTCKSLTYHESIYKGFNSEARLKIYKARVKAAFGVSK